MSKLPAFLCLFAVFCSFVSFSQEEILFRLIDILFDLEKLKTVNFGTDSLNGDKLLFQFFPAPMNEEESERETLPFDTNFTVKQNVTHRVTGLIVEKPVISIQYTDSKGMVHNQIVTTQNTHIR